MIPSLNDEEIEENWEWAENKVKKTSCCDRFCGALDCFTCRGTDAIYFLIEQKVEQVRQSKEDEKELVEE